MGLREEAALDAREFLEDEDDFGWPITLKSPEGVSAELVGYSTDIHYTIDPETGQAVSGRTASIAIPLAALAAASLEIPKGVAERNAEPWVVTVNDISGVTNVFKVLEAMPDRTLGIVTCTLEAYRAYGT